MPRAVVDVKIVKIAQIVSRCCEIPASIFLSHNLYSYTPARSSQYIRMYVHIHTHIYMCVSIYIYIYTIIRLMQLAERLPPLAIMGHQLMPPH